MKLIEHPVLLALQELHLKLGHQARVLVLSV